MLVGFGKGPPIFSDGAGHNATQWSRERAATVAARESMLVDLLADWQEAQHALRRCYAGMYALGMRREEIARRLDLPMDRVPVLEDRPGPEDEGDGSAPGTGTAAGPASPESLLESDHTF